MTNDLIFLNFSSVLVIGAGVSGTHILKIKAPCATPWHGRYRGRKVHARSLGEITLKQLLLLYPNPIGRFSEAGLLE